ncbi:hypothetical protein FCH28_29110 [Streptomyces piniterrae]|uniref:Uncharacterized protein n=1 Tax=Streptomyces piniterrae TaxID=2571125 RepID=A0A4U0MWE5_9ACTN|nr:hypothetical protein [Streptomyces piniterrae]TJZ45390.1 hypothetical protein FCH28_29110 [Streptomyces piniterrae]
MIRGRCAGAWSRLCDWAEETWGRYVSQRELYRQLDRLRADCKARTAWVDELTEAELAAMRRRLAESIAAARAEGNVLPNRPGSAR